MVLSFVRKIEVIPFRWGFQRKYHPYYDKTISGANDESKNLVVTGRPHHTGIALGHPGLSIVFPLTFLHLIVHEGGHALVNLIYRIPHTPIYVHPFSFSDFSRPMFDFNNAWMHLGGPVIGILLPLILFIPLWKHRSLATLLLVMLFP